MGKMKDSSLLKWAHNNNKNNNKGKSKEDKNKNWIHPAESLTSGHIAYLVKFLGSTEVDKPKGIEVVKDGIRKLKFNQQIKKAEGTKTPKVELTVSVDGVAIQDPKTKKTQHQYPLHRISYCADDKAEKRFFSFIAKEEDGEKHTCFVFVSDKLAEEITLTIGQAFDLAYKRYLSGTEKETSTTNIEQENCILKSRLREMSLLLPMSQLNDFLDKHNITDVCQIKESAGSETESTNGNVKSMSMDTSQASSDQSSDDQLINLDAPVSKFDNMTLDDLNDDDFDPRAGAGDSDSSDDFNPRNNAFNTTTPSSNNSNSNNSTPVIQPATHNFGTPIQNMVVTPVNQQQQQQRHQQNFGSSNAAATPPVKQLTMGLTPPVLPPRDNVSKITPASTINNNPFTNGTPQSQSVFGANDPFGMSTFNTPSEKNSVSAPGIDVFAELDPLKK